MTEECRLYDFLTVKKEFLAKAQRYTYTPAFIIRRYMKDLMVRSKDFYAIYDYETHMWIQDEDWAIEMMDKQVYDYALKDAGEALMDDPEHGPIVKRISDTDNHLIDKWHKFVQKDVRDSYMLLNQKVKFSNSDIKREDYATFKLSYPLQEGPTPYYDKLVNTLYLPEEREKFEFLTGAILAGDQSKIQKFFVFYGEPGSGKGTVINKVIVDTVLGGTDAPYTHDFRAELLVNRDQFGTEFLSHDPVLAYDNEAELSRVETCTAINTIVAHESTRVNPKYGRTFTVKPNCFLVCGSNEVIQLSPKSGFNRRLIDIRQTGEHLPEDEYDECIEHLKFEASGIAYKCYQLYKTKGKNYYNHYQPQDMLSQTSPFHNFVKDNYFDLKDGITLANAYEIYKKYCEETNLKTVMSRYKFRDTLKLYFNDYVGELDSGGKARFEDFKFEKVGLVRKEETKDLATTEQSPDLTNPNSWLKLIFDKSKFDSEYADSPAQYAKEDGTPQIKWAEVTTTLKDLDTTKLHYVKVPKTHIVIDLDIRDDTGEKSFEKNYAAAIQFPPTYAELSKSGSGIHLHYIWTGGDPEELSRVFDDNVEVKVFVGNAALRRKLTKCNDLEIAELSSGLPLKEVKEKVVDKEAFKGERWLRAMIIKNLKKEIHPATKPSIDFIDHLLKVAYASGKDYDVRDLYQPVLIFGMNSTHRPEYCANLVDTMHFASKSVEEKHEKENVESEEFKEAPIIILDIESYPEDKAKNMEALLLICWKYLGDDKPVVTMINPSPNEVKDLFKYRIVGHNVRDYDAHILYARAIGCSVAECNRISQRIINATTAEEKNRAKYREAYNIPYADTLDFAAASNKMGLKKWEIKLGVHHQEMGIPWDQAVPKELWPKVAEYCGNDVKATEAVWNYLQPDFLAREILAELSGKTIIDTTNQHTTALLTEGIRDPQKDYIYTDLSKIFPGYEFSAFGIDRSRYKEGAKIVSGKSIYKGIDPGEGGRKIGYPGMYRNVGLFDVASMHPSSMIRLNIFGDVITGRLKNLVQGRIAIKHKDYELAISLLGEKVRKYLTGDEKTLKRNAKALANALKTAINSVYGLTSASFNNKLRDPRNVDNIVAKYGALFMIDLEEELTNMGYKVVHVSTDSIKVADVDEAVWNYIHKRGQEMGFEFEWEAVYEKMTLVNDAVYIAKFMEPEECSKRFNYIPGDNAEAKEAGQLWSATGKQFQIPYVFKTLFSHEEIVLSDMCETFNVQKGALYLDMNESLPEGEHDYRFIGKIGQFTPVKEGCGGGILYRVDEGKYSAATGTKKPGGKSSYRWFESESIMTEDKETMDKIIDKSYYAKLVDDAVEAISAKGDFEWFVSDDSNEPVSDFMNKPAA